MPIKSVTTGTGPNLVVLHCWGLNHQFMQPFVDHLADRYTVTKVDIPGCGDSSWDEPLATIDDMADKLIPVLPDNATYIGCSIGGPLAFSLAARYPNMVNHIIGVGANPRYVEDINWPGFPKPGLTPVFEPETKKGYHTFMRNIMDSEFVDQDPKPLQYHQVLDIINNGPVTDMENYVKGLHLIDKTDQREDYSNLACPIDLICGELDAAVLMDCIEPLKALNPKANIHILENARHMPFWTDQQRFFELLDKMLP